MERDEGREYHGLHPIGTDGGHGNRASRGSLVRCHSSSSYTSVIQIRPEELMHLIFANECLF